MAGNSKYDIYIECGEGYLNCWCGGIVVCCIGCENGGNCYGI